MYLDTQDSTKPSRKGKERDTNQRALQPTDLDEKLTALRRKTAGAIKPRDRDRDRDRERERDRDRMQVAQPPQILLHPASTASRSSPKLHSPSPRQPPVSPRRNAPQRSTVDADHEDFSRRLRISNTASPPPRSTHTTQPKSSASKLFNPDTDPIPMRRTAEPDQMLDSPPHHQRQQRVSPGATAGRLFDHRKDDPVRFSVLPRAQGRQLPTPKSSADYVSASSTSSYAASISSSTFTLSSTTDGSSTSSALFDGRPGAQETDDSGKNVFSIQLKRLYRTITDLEVKIKVEDSPGDDADELGSRVMLKGKEIDSDGDLEKEKWKKQIADHKRLAEIIHNLLEISLAPSVPASLRNIPTKYNIIVRLWTYAFHKLLESLRRASFTSALALEHLQDFIYYAYTFYTGLLEEPTLNSFKSGWLEALGDLARYRMAVAAMVNSGVDGGSILTAEAVSEAAAEALTRSSSPANLQVPVAAADAKSVSDAPAARIDDSPSPSVGIVAARLLEVEPEKERWRNIARDWYGAGLSEQPGTGKLHHHLGLLSREVEGEELRSVYHFVKSMTTLHPFPTSRESILNIWSHSAQAKRALPDARAPDLFVLLHGMLFTNIQLDDFTPTLARFIERLEIEGAEEREWSMMAVTNIAAVLEYGKSAGTLRKAGGVGRVEGEASAAAMRVMAKKVAAGVPGSSADNERMDVDDEDAIMRSPHPSAARAAADTPEHAPAFKFALQLTFAMLSFVLRHPTRKPSLYARSNLNPYLPVILTFLATLLRHPPSLAILERSIPWEELAAFFATVPRKIMGAQGLLGSEKSHEAGGDRWVMLTSGSAPPLPEDWCLRGMEWVGRKVFERGYWRSGEDRRAELEVLDEIEGVQLTDGQIEDDNGEDEDFSKTAGELVRRWVRIVRSGVTIAGAVDGFTWVEGTREWRVEGRLAEKVARWREEERIEREEEERRRMGRRWVDDSMDVDEVDEESEESSEDDENDSTEVKDLKARRRYLRSLLQTAQRAPSPTVPVCSQRPRHARKEKPTRPSLNIVPGYTVLVIDTNILLSSLSLLSSIVESMRWTVIIPLPVLMELDGLSSNTSPQLADAAQAAVAYITSHVRSHSLSLKVQTSKGNYLTTLTVRTEQVDFFQNGVGSLERNMDDLILKAAIWQDEHWVDRSAMLKAPDAEKRGAVKVVLLSLDRNLRLKARSRQLPAASEVDLASILATATET